MRGMIRLLRHYCRQSIRVRAMRRTIFAAMPFSPLRCLPELKTLGVDAAIFAITIMLVLHTRRLICLYAVHDVTTLLQRRHAPSIRCR